MTAITAISAPLRCCFAEASNNSCIETDRVAQPPSAVSVNCTLM